MFHVLISCCNFRKSVQNISCSIGTFKSVKLVQKNHFSACQTGSQSPHKAACSKLYKIRMFSLHVTKKNTLNFLKNRPSRPQVTLQGGASQSCLWIKKKLKHKKITKHEVTACKHYFAQVGDIQITSKTLNRSVETAAWILRTNFTHKL